MNENAVTRIDSVKFRSDSGHIAEQTITINNVRPSWQRSGTGWAKLDIRACSWPTRRWLSLWVLENGEKSSRATSIDLNADAIRALRDMCNRALGE